MEVQLEEKQDTAVFNISGELDLYTTAGLKETFYTRWEEGYVKFLLDFSEVTYIDSTGVGSLISMYTAARNNKRRFYLTGVNGAVKRVIELTRLLGFLPIVDTKEEALHTLEGNNGEEITYGDSQTSTAVRKGIIQDEEHPLFNKKHMLHKDFNLDLKKVRRLSQVIVQKAPPEIREINLLEQQISEIIKNAVRHGNKNNPNKKTKIWFSFDRDHAHLIVEDEGEGFQQIDEWNRFYNKKQEAFERQDFEEMLQYATFRTPDSTESDGGNALFAAVEYWNDGVVFNSKGNAVAVRRRFDPIR